MPSTARTTKVMGNVLEAEKENFPDISERPQSLDGEKNYDAVQEKGLSPPGKSANEDDATQQA